MNMSIRIQETCLINTPHTKTLRKQTSFWFKFRHIDSLRRFLHVPSHLQIIGDSTLVKLTLIFQDLLFLFLIDICCQRISGDIYHVIHSLALQQLLLQALHKLIEPLNVLFLRQNYLQQQEMRYSCRNAEEPFYVNINMKFLSHNNIGKRKVALKTKC